MRENREGISSTCRLHRKWHLKMWKHYDTLHRGYERGSIKRCLWAVSCKWLSCHVWLGAVCDSNFPSFLRHAFPVTSRQHTNRKAGPFVFLVCCAEGLVIWNTEVNTQRNYKLALVLFCAQVAVWSWITYCNVHLLSLNDGSSSKYLK